MLKRHNLFSIAQQNIVNIMFGFFVVVEMATWPIQILVIWLLLFRREASLPIYIVHDHQMKIVSGTGSMYLENTFEE